MSAPVARSLPQARGYVLMGVPAGVNVAEAMTPLAPLVRSRWRVTSPS